MNKQITINQAWLERLIELGEKVAVAGDDKGWLCHLLGYIESAKELIDLDGNLPNL